MTLVIPSGFALGSFRGTVAFDPEEVVITCGFELTGSGSVTIANDLFEVWTEALDGISTTDWTFVGCDLKEGPVSTGPTWESSAATNPGVVTETGAPINTSILVRKSTALGGRKGRGRMYTVGQAYAGVYGMSGEVDDIHLALVDAAWLSILGGWSGVSGVADVVLLHSDATSPTTVVGLNPVKRMATQRRRLRP